MGLGVCCVFIRVVLRSGVSVFSRADGGLHVLGFWAGLVLSGSL